MDHTQHTSAPVTRLPYYDLAARGQDTQATPPCGFHHATIDSCQVVDSTDKLLQAFAAFVSAITELEQVAFVVDRIVQDEKQRRLISAKVPGADKPRSYSSENVDFSIIETTAIQGEELQFELQIDPGSPKDTTTPAPYQPHRRFKVVVNNLQENQANLTLDFDARHGPAPAASHLLDLVARYLAPIDAKQLPVPQLSRLNAPPKLSRPPALKPDFHKSNLQTQPEHPALLHGAFERRVAEFPDNSAIEYIADDSGVIQKWTYQEANTKAEAVAEELAILEHHISWQPAYKDQRAVALFIPSSTYLYMGMYGILKAGHAFCPLPLDAPPQRLLDILQDSQTAVVLGLGNTPFPGIDLSGADEVTSALRKLVWVDMLDLPSWRSNNPNIPSSSSTTERKSPKEEDLAYILYTSGSTGKPKGVLISHLSATCAIGAHGEYFDHLAIGPELRWLQFALPTFDLGLLEIFITFGLGGTLCVAERTVMLSDVERTVNLFQATTLFTVASLATLLRPEKLPTLTTLVSGGETLTKYAIDNFAYDAPRKAGENDRRVINIYGPTEATMAVTAETAGFGSRGSIVGDAFSCGAALLVDANSEDLIEVPMGLTGEIVFGGPQVGYGYLNRPVETAKAFVSGLDMGALYRTGDKGRIVWSPNGVPKLEILGRLTMEQVKLNGRRIELGEIEATIAQVDAIREIATVVLDGSFLAAYMALDGNLDSSPTTQSDEQVIAACRNVAEANLPSWMRPGEYTVVAQLPRTANGKVDRKVLHQIALEQFGISNLRKVPSVSGSSMDDLLVDLQDASSVRTLLVATVKSLTGNDLTESDPKTVLNSQGLDSLRAMELLQLLRKHDVEGLTLKDVLMDKTIDDVVQSVLEAQTTKRAEEAEATEMSSDEDILKIEDEEEFLCLPLAVKLRHFDLSCRQACVDALGIPTEDIVHVMPSTGLQTRMLAEMEVARDLNVNKPWVEHFPYEVPESIDADRLESAIITAMNNRDAFRTYWVQVPEHPLAPYAQCVLAPSSPHATLPIIKTTVPVYDPQPGSLWCRTIANAQKSAEEVFGLQSLGSVTTFVRSADNKHCVVVFSLFHMNFDGVSMENLYHEISRAYQGLPPTDGPKPGMRAPVEDHFKADWMETSMFWMMRLSGVPDFHLGKKQMPIMGAEFVTNNTGVGVASESLVSEFSMNDLFHFASKNQLFTPMAIVQAAWAMTLSQTQIEDGGAEVRTLDVQFGSLFHGRASPDSLEAFALMLDCLATRVVFEESKKMTHRELCSELFTQYTESLPYTELPCPSILFAKSTGGFDTAVVLQAYPKGDGEADSFNAMPGFNREENLHAPWRETNSGTAILMELWPGYDSADEKLRLRCSYSLTWPGYEFLTPEFIQGLLVAFNQNLIRVIHDSDTVFDPSESQ